MLMAIIVTEGPLQIFIHMKIIQRDNYNRETVSDVLVAENIQSDRYGEMLVQYLNDRFSGPGSPNFYTLEQDDYKLYVYDPT